LPFTEQIGREREAAGANKLRNHMGKKLSCFCLTIIVIVAGYVILFSADREYTREQRIGFELVVLETVHVDRRAYTSVWRGGDTLYLPVPASASQVVKQRLMHRERVVWEATSDGMNDRTVVFRLSPNGRFILLESQMHAEPWRILDLQSDESCVVSDPGDEIPDHAYIYPFDFLRWEEDSSRILARVSGAYVPGLRKLTEISEIWAVDPHNCSRVMIKHCEKPWSGNLDWRDTECQ
jgi:hypothetical protein